MGTKKTTSKKIATKVETKQEVAVSEPVVEATPVAEVKPTVKKTTTAKKATAKKATTAKKTATAKKATTPKKPAVKKEVADKVVSTDVAVKAEVIKDIKPVEEKPAEIVAVVATQEAPIDNKKNILFVCTEAIPYAGTGGLGEVMGSLPRAINEIDGDIVASVILPLYESFPSDKRDQLQFMFNISVPLAWRSQYCGVFKLVENNTAYYFIDNEHYFKRSNLYGYYDDGERFAFFSRAVNEVLPLLDIKVDVLHCQDWQTALVPVYYKLFYKYRDGYGSIKTLFTIHNIEYQGKYSKDIIEDVFGIPYYEYNSIAHGDCINLMKAAIDYSDAISTVSPTYAGELQDPFYAHGLEGVIKKNAYKMRGILNGVDTESYNSETNEAIFKQFSADTLQDKAVNKAELQKMVSLPESKETPLIAVISRLVSHKGLDILRAGASEILQGDVQLLILGKGDHEYEEYFNYLQHMYPGKVATIIAYNKDLSHKIYSGADLFLMPSKAEPCGLSQMMACRYATVPIVRATGGLRDSIVDCEDGSVGNGFSFGGYNAGELIHAVDRATGLFRDYKEKFTALMERCIKTDFSWSVSAQEYIKFYNEVL